MNRCLYQLLVLLLALPALSVSLSAQSANAVHILRPPQGANVALIVFEDLQCPDCANAAPLVIQAEEKYKIPVVRYNYPLPQHNWAMDAAILAEYFETKSARLGVEFREYIFKNQARVTRRELRNFAENFAQEHGTGLPFVLDPQGKLAETVRQDRALGQRVGIDHTPTIYISSTTRSGPSLVEVDDRSRLFQMIEQARAAALPVPAAPAASKTSKGATAAVTRTTK